MSDITIIGDSNDIFVLVGGVKIASAVIPAPRKPALGYRSKQAWTVTENDDEIDVACVLVH